MVSEKALNHELNQTTVLDYGRTDGENLPYAPRNKFFSIGYNKVNGLVSVCEDKGEPVFDGKVNIEELLASIQSKKTEEIDARVKEQIMKSYHNYWDYRTTPQNYDAPPTPILEDITSEVTDIYATFLQEQ